MIYVVIMAAVFLADYVIKDRIEKKDPKDVERTIVGGRIRLSRFHNTGMCMSIMKGRQKLVMAVSLIFTLLVTIYFIVTLTKGGSVLLKTGLALLLGGAYHFDLALLDAIDLEALRLGRRALGHLGGRRRGHAL